MNKLPWHQANVTFLRGQSAAARYPWGYVEVVDHQTPQSFALLEPVLSHPSCFIAVNNDPKLTLQHQRGAKGTAHGYTLICDDVFVVACRLSRIADDPATLRAQGFPRPVGAYNFDLQDSLGYEEFWRTKGEALYEVVRETHDRIPGRTCALILNLCLNAWLGMPPGEALEANTTLFLERFSRDFRGLTVDGLLGSNLSALTAKGALRRVTTGAYEVYRQTPKSMPMATMRLALRNGKAYFGIANGAPAL